MKLQTTPKNNTQLSFETSEDHPVTPRRAVEDSGDRGVAQISSAGNISKAATGQRNLEPLGKALRSSTSDVIDTCVGPRSSNDVADRRSADVPPTGHDDDRTYEPWRSRGWQGTVTTDSYGGIHNHNVEESAVTQTSLKHHRSRTTLERVSEDRASVLIARAVAAESADFLGLYVAVFCDLPPVRRDRAVFLRSVTLASAYMQRCAPQGGHLWCVLDDMHGKSNLSDVGAAHRGLLLPWECEGQVIVDALSSAGHARGFRDEARSGRGRRAFELAACLSRNVPITVRLVSPALPVAPIVIGVLA